MVELMSLDRVKEVFGDFGYDELGNGLIRIDPSWISVNTVNYTFPVIGLIKCHKLIQPSFLKIFTEIEQQGLGEFITLKGGGGCYCPRHTLWDKTKSLSKHAWAIPIDLNVPSNPYGKILNLPLSFNRSNPNTSKILSIFESNQFGWGGDWRSKDSMHFEPIPTFKPIIVASLLSNKTMIDVSSS